MDNDDTICPVCELTHFEFPDDYDICPICGWENDGVQRDDKDYWGGANTLSANESKTVYCLSQNRTTKIKVAQIIEQYKNRNNEIHKMYRNIDHSTSEGEKCRKEFAQAHNEFVILLNELNNIE